MPKDYPAFIIDRSRRSEASRFTDDFIVCTDKEVGFIARVYKIAKSRRSEMAANMEAEPSPYKYLAATVGESLVVLEVVRMTNEPVAHINRLPPLMKKALKAYLHGEEGFVKRGSLPYDEQIAAVEDVIRMAEAQRPHLEDMNGAAATDRFINALRDARESVFLLQKITKQ